MRIWTLYIFLFFTIGLNGQNPKPLTPTIEYVSVKPDNSVYIQWIPTTSVEAIGYFVGVFKNSSKFDVVKLPLQTSTTISWPLIDIKDKNTLLPQVNQEPVRFSVEWYNNLLIESVDSFYLKNHQTVFLNASFDSCNSRIKLVWTNYIGWGNKLQGYKVCVDSTDNIPVSPLDSFYTSNDTVQYFPVLTNKSYNFIIKAINGGLASSSNMSRVNTKMSKIPDILYAESASFSEGNNQLVNIKFALDPNSELHHYELFSSPNAGGPFSGFRQFPDFIGNSLLYIDTLKTTIPNYYQLKVIDKCGNTGKISNLATAMVPTYTISSNLINLSWNPYLNWSGTTSYNIYRSIGGQNSENIGSTNDASFQDDWRKLISQQLSGTICYYVEATNNNNSSISANVCIDLTEEIFIPNAFTPNDDGKNDVFKPSFAFLPSSDNYQMIIFNRYGSKIFESTNPSKGWNGRLGTGLRAPSGEYVYFISYSTPNGKKVTNNGTFSLIYP